MLVYPLILCLASAHYLYPEQIHLSWTENEAEMRVTWVTYLPVLSIISYRPVLCGDIPAPASWINVYGTRKVFNEGENIPRFQYIHTGVITGLRSECFYEYSVGDGLFWSDIFVFSGRTPDYLAPFDTSKVEFIVLGDWGTGRNGQATRHILSEQAKIRNFDAVLHVGDFAYDLPDRNGLVGDIWLNMAQPVAANYPYMTLPGNHEEANNFTHYKERFYMPVNEANQGTGYFYSFDMGPAHIVMMNTECYWYYSNITQVTQMNWLLDDLEKANQNRELRPWLIVLSHHPLYCSVNWDIPNLQSNQDCLVDTPTFQQALEDVFYENGVDVYMQAHVHNYERDCAIYKNKTVESEFDGPHIHIGPKAPIYITNGNAGNEEGHNDPTSPTPQDWAQYWSNDYGYGRMVIYNNTHLFYEQFSAPNVDQIDYVWIIKTQDRYN
jgi:acid phosphatase type 7